MTFALHRCWQKFHRGSSEGVWHWPTDKSAQWNVWLPLRWLKSQLKGSYSSRIREENKKKSPHRFLKIKVWEIWRNRKKWTVCRTEIYHIYSVHIYIYTHSLYWTSCSEQFRINTVKGLTLFCLPPGCQTYSARAKPGPCGGSVWSA